ncbi:MAG TPA: response regulator [Trichocoleus sp.]
MRILLIEDDEILTARLVESLTSQNYVVDAVDDGVLGMDYAQGTAYDLILTDVGLPHLDGITLCQRLRAEGCSTPILLMTAKDAPDERVRGLDAGADDHLTKPLNLEELHARLRALLRRGEVAATAVLSVGPLQLDPVRCQVTYDGQLLKLTPKEYNLLELFLRNPARVFSRGQIIEHLWNFDDPPLEESVKAHVKGLRRKLKQADSLEWIENVYGLGYRLNPDVLTTAKPASAPEPSSVPLEAPPEAPLEAQPQSSQKPGSGILAPTPALEQDFRQAMGGLWQQYQGLLGERLACLQAAAEAVQSSALTTELRRSAAHAAHKLAGVLGMFELDQGTAIARQIETILEAEPSPAEAAEQSLPALVSQLAALMELPATKPPALSPTVSLLLIALEPDLASELQALAAAAGWSWAGVATLEEARRQVQQAVPERVILELTTGQRAEGLALLQELASHTPPITALGLTPAESLSDDLGDRVAIAHTGLQRLLVKPVTATQIWFTLTQTQGRDRPVQAKVLVVDDDPLIPATLRPLLEPWGMQVVGLELPQRFWQVLNDYRPDLLILDVEMPQFSGIDLCQAVRIDPQWQNLPVVFLTAHQSRETVQQVFSAGADDFVSKPIAGPELLTRILNRLERNRLLQIFSGRDPLTGLLNYSQSRRDLETLIQRAHREHQPLAFALLKLSGMAALQTRHGHDAVHQILRYWGEQLQLVLRSGDVAGYWGCGDLVLGLLGQDQTAAADFLAPTLQRLRQHILTIPNGERLQPEFGAAIVTLAAGADDGESLYRLALERLA